MNQLSYKQLRIQQIWSKAEVHKFASKVGFINNSNHEVCPCCDQIIQKQPIPMCQHTKQFQSYGFGYPLWFSFLKYCILLIVILIASKSGPQLYIAAHQNYEFCYGTTVESHQFQIQQAKQHNMHDKKLLTQLPLHGQNNILTDNPTMEKSFQSENLNKKPDHESKYKSEDNTLQKPEISHVILQNHLINNQRHLSESKVLDIKNGNTQQSKINYKRVLSPKNGQQTKCTSFMVYLSLINSGQMHDNNYLKLIIFIVHMMALVGIRNMVLKQQQYYDERKTLISKYSLLMGNLPKVYGIKSRIIKMFSKQFNFSYGDNQQNQIKEIIFVFKDQQLEKLNKFKELLEQKILNASLDNNQEDKETLQEELSNLEHQILIEIQRLKKDIHNDHVICDKVIIIMRTEGDKAAVLYQFKQNKNIQQFNNLYFQDINEPFARCTKKVYLKQAPQPNEIIWENIDLPDNERRKKIIKGWIFTILLLIVITTIFYFILLLKTRLFIHLTQSNTHNDSYIDNLHAISATTIVYVAILSVVMFNKFIMGTIIHKFVYMQEHAYTDKQNHSFALKYALGMFFTTALMTLAVQALTFENFYSHQYGVIQQETIMFFVTSFIIPLIWFIHPYSLIKKRKRNKLYNTLVSQKVANQISQDYHYDLGKRYAEIFEIMWFTFLYSDLLPLGVFLVLIGLILYYWVDKYNFLRRSTVLIRVSGKMAILGLKSLDATLFLRSAGQFLFHYTIRGVVDYQSIIFVVIGLLFLFMPISSIIWSANSENFFIEEKPYEVSKVSFKQNYINLHPVYKFTHFKQNEEHRINARQYMKKSLTKIGHYGTGRGHYKKNSTIVLSIKEKNINQHKTDIQFNKDMN